MKYISVVLIAFISMIATEVSAKKKTMYINHQYVNCTGVAPQQCLQVKYNEKDNWQYLYQPIEGFTFEPGNDYEIVVNEKKLCKKRIPADGSSKKIKLVKVVNKTPVMSVALPQTSLTNDWFIQSILVNGVLTDVSKKGFTLKIDDNTQRFSARFCNTIGGKVENGLGHTLKFSQGMSTKMYCDDIPFETAFSNIINQADNFEIDGNGGLIIKNGNESLMVLSAAKEIASETLEAFNYKGQWKFKTLLQGKNKTDLSAYGNTITLSNNGEKISGKAICNGFFGTLSIDEQAKTIGFGNIGATLMLCPGKDAEVESSLFKVLNNAKKYEVKGSSLWLSDDNGNKIELIK
ncbi:META domain-containing protein [Polluticaenibacter yanchengensis]|uniref:META domain-containing protein n=1 Tax=Polluticaenibacter yanchengensis TaxID=3014562 RepID=A0ABT4UHX0_9BACT|nr:META domain-containing protein [Chitinophagaceae bacterium LY-5]